MDSLSVTILMMTKTQTNTKHNHPVVRHLALIAHPRLEPFFSLTDLQNKCCRK